jgi:hypothetical protein
MKTEEIATIRSIGKNFMQTFRILGILTFFFMSTTMLTINKNDLLKITEKPNPFDYNLDVRVIPGTKPDAHVTICCHGYGYSNQIAGDIHSSNVLSDHLIGFNFPDHEIRSETYDPMLSNFGSINEILPLLYVIKLCVIDLKLSALNLYGFSAGGGAVINAIATLNHKTYDQQLATLGITAEYKNKMLQAIQNGLIILDCPLKSIEEIIETRGTTNEFMILAKRYANNNMRPIDTANLLKGLALKILVHFEVPDDILGNSLDDLFVERLHSVNQGTITVTKGNHGGHNAFHSTLWNQYRKLKHN